jgi:HEAT repeat protein/energy-coupling factor transporter ATP-binding protein EcfA2
LIFNRYNLYNARACLLMSALPPRGYPQVCRGFKPDLGIAWELFGTGVMPRPTYGPEVQRRTAALFTLLLDYANDDLAVDERALERLRPQIQTHWQSEQRLVVRTNVRSLQALSQLGHNSALTAAQIKESLRRLGDFLAVLDDNRPNPAGSETWHFTLKLWCHRRDRARLLEQFAQHWESRRSQPTPTSFVEPTLTPDLTLWLERCALGLTHHLTTNPLTLADQISFDWRTLYVPLGIMPRPALITLGEPPDPAEVRPQFPDQFLKTLLAAESRCRVAMIGEPGTGKTTLLQHLAQGLIQAQQLPIWVSLADLQGTPLEQFVVTDWLKMVSRQIVIAPELQQDLTEQVQQGRVWLLLDAIDEMALEPSVALTTLARQLRGWLEDAHIILTCRSHVWESGKNSLADFDCYSNLTFSEQTQPFIQQWFSNDPDLGERLWLELVKPERSLIRDLVKNPLRLALLCRAWSRHQGFPTTRAMLYHQFVEALYDWKQDRMPTTLGQRQQLNRALGELAIAACRHPQPKFRLSHSFMVKVWGEHAAEWLPLALSLGWLTPVGRQSGSGEKMYAFCHPTFQEYFAAQAIPDWSMLGSDWLLQILAPQWREVVLFWLGRVDLEPADKAKLLQTLYQLDDPTGYYRPRAYFLAAAGSAECSEIPAVQEIAQPIAAQLLRWRFGHYNPEQAAWQWYPSPLQNGSQTGLVRMTRPGATTAYETYLQQQPAFFARWHAAYSLGNTISPQHPLAISTLRDLVQIADNIFLQIRLCEALVRVNPADPIALTTLSEIFATATEEAILRKTAYCLAKINQDAAAIATLERLAQTAEPHIRRQAAASLAQLIPGHPLGLVEQQPPKRRKPPRGERAPDTITREIASLLKKLEQPTNLTARIRYAYRLGKLVPDKPRAIETLLVVLQEPGHEPALYRWVADCLSQVLTRQGMPVVIAALHPLIPAVDALYTPQTATVYGILWDIAQQLTYQEFQAAL